MTPVDRINKANEIKAKMREEFLLKGYSSDQIGQLLDNYPKYIAGIEGNAYPQWFRDSLVCWYNPSKQGVKNGVDIIAGQTWKLKDFSGNGLDMDMHGFLGEGMSGMDGYVLNFKDCNKEKFTYKEKTQSKIIVTHTGVGAIYQRFIDGSNSKVNIGGYTLKVRGLPEKGVIRLTSEYRVKEGEPLIRIELQKIEKDGEYQIPVKELPTLISGRSYLDKINIIPENSDMDLTIEQLPLYEGGLVFDGVDDYGVSENQPILTDYTVMARRKIIKYSIDSAAIAHRASLGGVDGAFIFERETDTWSFGLPKRDLILETNDISWQSKNSYNGTAINNGTLKDTKNMTIGKYGKDKYVSFTLYDFLLFNRTLTPDEIDWVKYNIMGDELPKPIAVWDAKGRRNDEPSAIRSVLLDKTGNGHNIELKNFDWVEGSGYKDNALYFDGVDDYGICENMPIFTKEKGYTIIAEREIFKINGYLCVKAGLSTDRSSFLFEGEKNVTFGCSIKVDKMLPNRISWSTTPLYNMRKNNVCNAKESNAMFYLGAGNPNANKWNGALYSLHIFDHDLTPTEIELYIQRNIDKNYTLPKVEQVNE